MVSNENGEGFVYVTEYSNSFKKLIERNAQKAKRESFNDIPNGIGIFLFGSPSRQEMVDESDADIMIIRKENNEDYEKFRQKFMKSLEEEDFPKIDIPSWGTLEECETYLKSCITEGNQVIEAKFIWGDPTIEVELNKIKDKYCNVDKFERILCFQKLYFDQYYSQRIKNGSKNVKYGHGGTRDFMFITWFSNLLDLSEGKKINFGNHFPQSYLSLSNLYARKLIGFKDYLKFLKNLEIVMILRNQILIQNKWTPNEGLTYLDEQTINILFKRKIFRNKEIKNTRILREYLESAIDNVSELKRLIWNLYLENLRQSRGIEWYNNFSKILEGNISKEVIRLIEPSDTISKMGVIWNLNKEDALFKEIFEEYSSLNEWEILASICCHKDCPPEILDRIAMEKAITKGYEYILRIISRNKNTLQKTLENIINNERLEERYRIVAKTTLEKGVKRSNESR